MKMFLGVCLRLGKQKLEFSNKIRALVNNRMSHNQVHIASLIQNYYVSNQEVYLMYLWICLFETTVANSKF